MINLIARERDLQLSGSGNAEDLSTTLQRLGDAVHQNKRLTDTMKQKRSLDLMVDEMNQHVGQIFVFNNMEKDKEKRKKEIDEEVKRLEVAVRNALQHEKEMQQFEIDPRARMKLLSDKVDQDQNLPPELKLRLLNVLKP